MSQIELTTLGKSCEFFNGKAHEKSIDENGKYIVVNSKFISQEGRVLKRTKEQLFPLFKGDIVMVMSDVPNGKALAKCFIVDKDDTYSLNQRICCIRSKQFDTKYLYYQLNRNEHFLAFNNGENQTNLRKDDILDCPLIKPSLEEQTRIVTELSNCINSLEKVKDNIERNITNSEELFEGYLHEIFTRKGEGWAYETLENLIQKGWILSHLDGNHGGDYPKKEEFVNEGVPYISANCIEGTDIDFLKAKYLTPQKAATFRKGVAVNNDVLFAHNATVGPVAILRTNLSKIILGTSLTYYRCNTNFILPEYLANYMRSYEFKSQYESVMRQSTRNQVPITKQREFYHIIPPIEFQESIISKLEMILEQSQILTNKYQEKLNSLEELKMTLFKKAFENELIEAEQ
jgi:type I restriction enzyme S subunit